MALETGTYIDSLVATNPTGTDDRSKGDDHLRLIKSTVLNTFPNITGEVTATQAELNLLAGATSLVPSGVITMWAGSVASIPTGWQLCNGSGLTTAGDAVPDLRDKFVIGAGSAYAVAATGGQATPTISATGGGHALTVAQMPSHKHSLNGKFGGGSGASGIYAGGGDSIRTTTSFGDFDCSAAVSNNGSGQSHSHSVSVTNPANSNLPPYYALAYIIKL